LCPNQLNSKAAGTLSRDQFIELVLGTANITDVAAGQPGEAALGRLLSVLDLFNLWFGMATP
jgi:hypothetical protein